MDKNESIEIPFGAFDSELKGWEYTIPEDMEAEIKDGKIIVREKDSEDERTRKSIIRLIQVGGYMSPEEKDKAFAWLEKQGEQNLANSAKTCKVEQNPLWSEEDERILYNVKAYVGYAAGQRGVKDELFKEANEWLKALKERYTWKPSDKQMEALKVNVDRLIMQYPGYEIVLKSLYDDLRKLKG